MHYIAIAEFQTLADSKAFKNGYLEPNQYLLTLARIHELQLKNQMLADASRTLFSMMSLNADSMITTDSRFRHEDFEMQIDQSKPLETKAELTPIYRGGPGSWEGWLARPEFAIENIRGGKVDSVFLVCENGERRLDYPYSKQWSIPAGMKSCKIEVSGASGTRMLLRQLPTVAAPAPVG